MAKRNAAEFFDRGDSLLVDEGYAIPKDIASGRLDKQCALTDGELRLGLNRNRTALSFEMVAMFAAHTVQRCPLLTAVTDILPFVFTNRAG